MTYKRKGPPIPPWSPGPGRGVDASEGDPDDVASEDLPHRDVEEELAVVVGTDKIAYIEARLRIAVDSQIRAERLRHYNTVKNWEGIIHRLRRELDAERDARTRAAEIAGMGTRLDPAGIARKVLANLPALASVAPKDAEEVLRQLARCLGKTVS